jgi:hypothetical protein
VAFGKPFGEKGDSAIVSTRVFSVEGLEKDSDFLDQVAFQRAANNDKKRFKVLSVSNEQVSFKAVACLKFTTLSEDHGKKGVKSKDFLYLENRGYVCRHPANPTIALQMEVSLRSKERGFPDALTQIGDQFFGDVIPISFGLVPPQQSAAEYQRAAANGNARAARDLGQLLENGLVKINEFGTAGHWYLRACDLGDLVGCHNAGVGFENGQASGLGLEKDYGSARDAYSKAAARGYMQSQYNLGSLYANSYIADDIDGLKWLLVAQKSAKTCVGADQSLCAWVLRDPPGHIAKLRQRMSADAQAKAVQLANEWTPTN